MFQFKILAIFILALLMSACQINHNNIDDLLIDLSGFPKGWSVSIDGPSPIAKAPLGGTKSIKSIELFFYVYGGGAYEEIRLFNHVDEATDEYERQNDHIFRETDFTSPWKIPDNISIDTLNTDQYYYACSQSIGTPWPECDYIAQYGLYFVHFHTGMYPGYMSYQDFGKIVLAIDTRMAKFSHNK